MILVIQGILPHYRVGFFNALATLDKVVVAHSGATARQPVDRFEEVILPMRSIGPFRLQFGLIDLIERLQPDVVIAMFDLRWLATIRAMYRFDRRLNWVWWGLGAGAYGMATFAKTLLARRPNPIVFYSERSRIRFRGPLPQPERLFVARNTLLVPNRGQAYQHQEKTTFINVGSLDARKRNDVTIQVLRRLIDAGHEVPRFVLVGEGVERGRLEQLVDDLGMRDHVEFAGFTNDPDVLAAHYRQAIASVSFGQAGLAVLQSLAYGVPFVTSRNAVSSGESENILDGVTGILCEDSPHGLEQAMLELIKDPNRARQMGAAAYDHFSRTATLENMVAQFQEAIAYGAKRNH